MSHEIARHWRLRQQRYALVGECCPNCNTKIFPPRDICTDCGGEAKDPYKFSGKGKIYSFAPVMEPAEGFESQAPFAVALIKLDEGPMLTAQLTDLDPNQALDKQIKIGIPVEMVTRKLSEDGSKGLINYGYKFRIPIQTDSSRLQQENS